MKINLRSKSILMAVLFAVGYHFSIAQNGWKTVEAENTSGKRHENAFVKVGEKFYLLGGRGIKPVEIYDPATDTWSEGAMAPLEISHFQAVSYQGLIYVMGALVGGWPSETPLSHILIYDPLQDKWMIGPEIPPHRQRGAAGAIAYNDKIYLVCGIVNGHTSGWVAWMDEYDPATNTWKELPDAPQPRDHFQAAVLDDQLVVTGGRKSGYQGKGFEATIAETDVYDFNTGTWNTLPSTANIPTQRAGCTAVAVGEEVIVIGGESGSQKKAHAEVEALNIKTKNWRKLPALQTGRHGTQVVLSEGNLYVAAGCGNRGGSPELNSFETYALPGADTRKNEPVAAGTLKVSATSHTFEKVRPYATQTATFELSNTGGNQGIPLSYVIVAGSEDFEIDFPFALPYMLLPGKTIRFDVNYTPQGNQSGEGTVLIKVADRGKTQPQEILLKGN